MFDFPKEKIKALAENNNLSLIILFGSQARNKTHPQSDVDLGFLSVRFFSLADIAKMQFEFSQELKIENIEMVDLKSAPPLLLRRAAEQGILLYEKAPSGFARFKIYAFKRHMEAKPLLGLRKAALNKFLQKV